MTAETRLQTIVFDIVEKIDDAKSIAEASQTLLNAVQPVGCSWFALTDTSISARQAGVPYGPLVVQTAADDAFDNPAGKFIFDNNPSPEMARRVRRPFLWSMAPLRTKALYGTFWEAMGELGIKNGIAVPSLDRGVTGGVSVALRTDDFSPRETRGLEFVCYAFIDKVRALSPAPQKYPKLTPRERDCLAFVAEGKTDWEISVILGISQSTAHLHVESARRKLESATRAQAVARFIIAGLR